MRASAWLLRALQWSCLAALLTEPTVARSEGRQCLDQAAHLGVAINAGQGLVVQGWGTDPSWLSGSTGLTIEHCASGEGINVTAQTWSDFGSIPEEYHNPYDILRAAMDSPDSVTFDDLVARFDALGMSATRTSSQQESCGCAVYYPELRGSKTR